MMDTANSRSQEKEPESADSTVPDRRNATPRTKRSHSPEAATAQRPRKYYKLASSSVQNPTAVRNLTQLPEFRDDDCYTQKELEDVYNRARYYHPWSMAYFDHIHRAVEDSYLEHYDQTGYMKTKQKDATGHRQCPATGRLSGVFFSPKTFNRGPFPGPIPFSPYGRNLLLVRPEKLFTREHYNLYFADYYCFRGSTGEHCL